MSGRVGVLMGGRSGERAISLASGRAVAAALAAAGVDAVPVVLGEAPWCEAIRNAGIARAFVALHGTWGEDGCVQGMLEILGIPYTGSGPLASALCMDKRLAKRVLREAGLRVPADVDWSADGAHAWPVVVKPRAEGSSLGVRVVRGPEQWRAPDGRGDWLVEELVGGVEVAVGVLEGEPLPPVEVAPRKGLYDYEAKYTKGATEYFCPPRLPEDVVRRCMDAAARAAAACGCTGAPRVDMIVPEDGEPVVLEVNTIPGMTETSLLPKAAQAAGIGFTELCLRILGGARLHHPLSEAGR